MDLSAYRVALPQPQIAKTINRRATIINTALNSIGFTLGWLGLEPEQPKRMTVLLWLLPTAMHRLSWKAQYKVGGMYL